MPLIIVPAATFSGGSSSGDHTHSNATTLNKLSSDAKGNLLFGGKIVGEKSIETAYSLTLTASQIAQKNIELPDDCDTSKAITLSLNGLEFSRGDFWEVIENVDATTTDIITWDGLSLENIARTGDTILITYYKKI